MADRYRIMQMPETWILTTENWSLPVVVEWPEQNDVAAVSFHPDVPLLKVQRQAIENELSKVGKFRNGQWWVLRIAIQAMGKITTEDPELAVVWRPIEARVKFRSGEGNEDRDEFFAEYSRTGVISDPAKAEVVFVSMCKHMLSWMLNHQRPVNLGFCDLYAVPYRPNWKQIIFQRLQGKKSAANKKVFSRRDLSESSVNKLIERGVADELIDPKLLFWCKKDGHMYWSIEARPKNMWWRMVKAVEMAKKNKRHGGLYLAGIADTMKRLLPQSLELYASNLQQVCLPFVKLAASVRRSGGKFVRPPPPSRMLGQAPLAYMEPVVHPGRKEPCAVLDDVSSAAFVSSLSAVQLERLSVRDARADLEKSKNGAG